MPLTLSSILALDVGAKRIGVAITSQAARLPRPLITLEQGKMLWPVLRNIVDTENVDSIIVGLPRGLSGQDTAQTSSVMEFVNDLHLHFSGISIYLQDEALTSKLAEAELHTRGKNYNRGDIDSLAATYILEDWLSNQGKGEKL